MKNIIFIAPPAAGKGSQSELISKKYGIPHVSIGALLRCEVQNNTEIGKLIKDEIRLGKLVNDNFTVKLLTDRLSENDCKNGFILDGFPRNIKQIEFLNMVLNSINKKITHVIHIDIDKETALKRTIGRLVCSGCGSNFNDEFPESMPLFKGKCDHCAKTLLRREDDTIEVFETRYKTYLEETIPLLDYFEKEGYLYRVDGSISKETTFNQIINILEDNNGIN